MTTNYHTRPDRLLLLCLFALIMLIASVNSGFAQKRAEIQNGVFRIKVSEGLFKQLEKTKISKSATHVVSTGIETLDVINKHHKVSNMRRLFPDGGRFEAKHRKHGLHRWYELEIDTSASVMQVLPGYKSLNDIEKAEPVYRKAIIGADHQSFGPVVLKDAMPSTLPGTSNDPLLSNQWHYQNTGQSGGTAGADIRLMQAWQLETGSRDIIVSVHDGGIQVNHVDLMNNIWINPNEVSGNGIDDDNNGYIDDVNGYNFADNTAGIPADNHGSHVGGTIAATNNNGTGVAGVAGGSGDEGGVRLMSCAVFGNFNVGGFAESYIYAADNGSVISQNSWGYTSPDVYEQSVIDAIDYFIAEAGRDEMGNQVGRMNGGLVIFAAGNANSSDAYYPAYYSPVFSVAATNHQDRKAWYSNYGSWIDIAAPGGETSVTEQGVLSTLLDNQYGYFQGTSMACPHVTGVAALVVSKYGGPGFTPTALRARLNQTADNIEAADPDFAGLLGSGRVNAFAALQQDDEMPPEMITDLSIADIGITSITLTWTAPADEGNEVATSYDLRYSISPITVENFDEASPVYGEPVPRTAGSPEFYTVTDLLPGTSYFFAIRSADFFNNVSGISNVLDVATNFPPSIAIYPEAITADLLTAGHISKSLTISNNGAGPLNFEIDTLNLVSFFTVSIQQGMVSPNGSADVEVIFDGNGLLTGTYQDSLVLWTNDPENPQLVISVTANVTNNGYPIASVSPDALDFGGVFQGASKQILLNIHNAGSENLVISNVESDNVDFTFNFNEPVEIAPFADSSVAVTYTPSSLGLSQGTLMIYTNDPDKLMVNVPLSGSGTEAPAIQVSPEALSATLFSNHTVTKQLTVQNQGGSDLEFSVEVSSAIPATTTVLKHIDIPRPANQFASTGAMMVPSSPRNQASGIEVKSVSPTSGVSKVLILSPDYYVNDLAAVLNGMEDLAVDVFPFDALPSISVAHLLEYDVVLTTNNFQWWNGGIDPAAVGNILADYIDQGGKVIMNQFSIAVEAGWKIEGRFMEENYGAFVNGTGTAYTYTSLGTLHEPQHPIFAGVTSLNYEGYLLDVGLATGATAIASWDTGHLFLAANDNVVALNLLPSIGFGGAFPWGGDLPSVFHNAIKWLAKASYLSVNPVTALVPPGQQVILDVTFDAKRLPAGEHAASLDILSNVPGNELVTVPAMLTVTGPQFSVSPSSVFAELLPGETSAQTIMLQNNGSADHTFEIIIQDSSGQDLGTEGSFVAVSPSSGIIAAGGIVELHVSFDAAGLSLDRVYTNVINITADVDRIRIPAALHVPAPDFTVNPGWIHREIEIGESATGTLTLRNNGRGAHPFEITVQNYGIFAAMAMAKQLGIAAQPLENINPDTRPLDALMEKLSLNPHEKFDPKLFSLPQNVKSPLYTVYATSFDEFNPGDINQNGWYGWGSWNVSTENPYTGDKHIRLLGVGMEEHNSANSPWVGIGYEPFSSTTMKVMLQGSGTYRWIIAHSPTAQTVPTVILFFPDNTIGALTIDDVGNVYFENVPVEIPSGYFDLTIEVERSTSKFSLYFNQDKVFTGQGLTGNIEYVEIYSRNESASDAIYDVDDFQLIDGKRIFTPYLTVTPSSGTLASGETVDLTVTMDTKDLSFGLYPSDIVINVADVRYIYVPANFEVVGDPEIEVDPVLLDAVVDYRSESSYYIKIKNTGGRPLNFNLEALAPVTATGDTSEWLLLIPSSGELPAGGEYYIEARFQSRNLDVGNYTGIVKVNSNAALNPSVEVPVSLRVLEPARIVVTPNSLQQKIVTGGKAAQSIEIRNEGESRLLFSSEFVPADTSLSSWIVVYPQTGLVEPGQSFESTVIFDAAALTKGAYEEVLYISSNDPEQPHVTIPVSLDVVLPPQIVVEPGWLKETLYAGTSSEKQLKISNAGEADLNYSFMGYLTSENSQKRNNTSRIYPAGYHVGKNSADTRKGHPVLTGHGELDNFGNTWIDSNEPGGPVFNWMDITTTGQAVFLGDDDMILVSMPFEFQFYGRSYREVTIGSNGYLTFGSVGWPYWNMEIPNAEEPNDILPIFWDDLYPPAGGSIHYYGDAEKFVVQYTNVPYFYATHLPNTFQVILYSDGTIVYQYLSMIDAQSATIGIENADGSDGLQVAFNTPYINNNLAILFYNGARIQWITPETVSGSIAGGTDQFINLKFNAEGMPLGEYQGDLKIFSNDPEVPVHTIGVALEVTDNFAPAIQPVSNMNLIETQSVEVTFLATDPDDSLISIHLADAPAFFEIAESGNGTATYSINPQIGDAGDRSITVVATDARGKTSTSAFQLSVIQYGVDGFSLVNRVTGEVYNHLSETTVIDQNDVNFTLYAIRANVKPASVGSVVFVLNGKQRNRANHMPYLFSDGELQLLDTGDYVLNARAFTSKAGKGLGGRSAEVQIQIVNSSDVFASKSHAVNIYPMPVNDVLNIQLTGTIQGETEILILNADGRPVFNTRIDAEQLKDYQLHAVRMGLRSGIYYLQIFDKDGVKVTRRFIKE